MRDLLTFWPWKSFFFLFDRMEKAMNLVSLCLPRDSKSERSRIVVINYNTKIRFGNKLKSSFIIHGLKRYRMRRGSEWNCISEKCKFVDPDSCRRYGESHARLHMAEAIFSFAHEIQHNCPFISSVKAKASLSLETIAKNDLNFQLERLRSSSMGIDWEEINSAQLSHHNLLTFLLGYILLHDVGDDAELNPLHGVRRRVEHENRQHNPSAPVHFEFTCGERNKQINRLTLIHIEADEGKWNENFFWNSSLASRGERNFPTFQNFSSRLRILQKQFSFFLQAIFPRLNPSSRKFHGG